MTTSYKVMLKGKAGVGKTMMMRKLIGDNGGQVTVDSQGRLRYTFSLETSPTLGVEVHSWSLNNFSLNVWDLSSSYPGENPEAYWVGARGVIHLVDSLDDVEKALREADESAIPTLLFNDRQDVGLRIPSFRVVNAKTGRGVEDALSSFVPSLSAHVNV